MKLTTAEREAVAEAAARMAEWHRAHVGPRRGGRMYHTASTVKRTGAQRSKNPPNAPIEALLERGVIDGRRDAHLTALAFLESRNLLNGERTK